MNTYQVCSTALFAVALCGCAAFGGSKTAIRGKSIEGVNYIDFPSERRGAWVIKNATTQRIEVCAEPFSDTGVSTEQLVSLSANLPKDQGSATASAQAIKNLVELKGRTPAVLALRDVMYRLCERRLSSTTGEVPKDELEIYRHVVEVIADFAYAERADAEAVKAEVIPVTKTATPRSASKYEKAKEAQDRGFALLTQCKWKDAEKSFANAESIYPGFQISYEMARLLRINEGGNIKQALLNYHSSYMSSDVMERVEKCHI